MWTTTIMLAATKFTNMEQMAGEDQMISVRAEKNYLWFFSISNMHKR